MSATMPFDSRQSTRLGPLILRLAVSALLLQLLKIVLTLPGNVGPEEFVALSTGEMSQLLAMVHAWGGLTLFRFDQHTTLSLLTPALWYFAFDTMFFVPVYGALLLEIARRIAMSDPGNRRRRIGAAVLAAGAVLLMGVDVSENASGLAKLALSDIPSWVIWLWALLAPVVGYHVWKHHTPADSIIAGLIALEPGWPRLRTWLRVVLGIALLLSLTVMTLAQVDASSPLALMLSRIFHIGKVALLIAVSLWLVALALGWIFLQTDSHGKVAILRRGMADMLWRSRYVLIALIALAALTLIMDQCRDVTIGVIDSFREHYVVAAIVLGLSVFAVWAMSFSCWLWTRLALRTPGPLSREPRGEATELTLEKLACALARTLGVLPAFIAALMSAYAARDAVWAASLKPDQPNIVPFVLICFGALSLIGGIVFVWHRARKATFERYYDGVNVGENWASALSAKATEAPGMQATALLDAKARDASAKGSKVIGPHVPDTDKYRFLFLRGNNVMLLPMIALALAVALRGAGVLLEPKVPLAFPVIVYSLIAWLGFFAWLSLKEQREARPWVILIVLLVGVIGFVGLSDNHVVRSIGAGANGRLPAPGSQVLGAGLLALCVIVAALVLHLAGNQQRSSPLRWKSIVARVRRRRGEERGSLLHWTFVLPVAALAGIMLIAAVDRFSKNTERAVASSARPRVDRAFSDWLDKLQQFEQKPAAATDPLAGRVFFVTSEGGGIRAAYWTARTLQKLSEQLPTFNRRTFMLSGVSGGAVGEALYAACLRSVPRDKSIAGCVDRFGTTDLLTPMLGAWLFEDALARVLPTSVPKGARKYIDYCTQPGCGFMSRGLWFEQALERGVPKFAEGIAFADAQANDAAQADDRVPHLFLNSTWVESGDRAIASGVNADWNIAFAAARDQIVLASKGQASTRDEIDLPLSAAAHNAARFPFVNAIGVLRSREDKGEGHLADGGYFDNSGAHTAADALAALRLWIDQQPGCAHNDKACEDRVQWLRDLKPTIIVIQNGVSVSCDKDVDSGEERLECLKAKWRLPSKAPQVDYLPEKPLEAASWHLYVDAVGPLVATLNVGGTGANGRRAEALLKRACQRYAAGQSSPADQKPGADQKPCVARLAQREDGILYPLGWYLSKTAQSGLDAKARAEVCRFVEDAYASIGERGMELIKSNQLYSNECLSQPAAATASKSAAS